MHLFGRYISFYSLESHTSTNFFVIQYSNLQNIVQSNMRYNRLFVSRILKSTIMLLDRKFAFRCRPYIFVCE
ncbi:hypothetical protein HanXRQr2_Chr08g0328571 [Helianthus annuus]|uniref:Uncharacterized protein n=1 Tax=Helianthus annuus TaxID=4232 RepID=A0A9K3NBM8_HELAN|nr:hypothetical protein HanXRQr2_Chr08g0328571 [Helianthus annuus]KAJ0900777.1 hypothetical protein HanPSC8_Chr08g0317611 [Helianthus annuus]